MHLMYSKSVFKDFASAEVVVLGAERSLNVRFRLGDAAFK